MKDLIGDIRYILVDRLKNRFVGSYMVAWVLYNWKSLLTLAFGRDDIAERVAAAETSLTLSSFLWPVLFTFIFLVASPWISFFVDVLQGWAVNSRKNKKAKDQRDDLRRDLKSEDLRLELQNKRLETATAKEFEQKLSKALDERVSSTIEDFQANIQKTESRADAFQTRIEILDQELKESSSSVKYIDKRLNALAQKASDFEKLNSNEEARKDPHLSIIHDNWQSIISSLMKQVTIPELKETIDNANRLCMTELPDLEQLKEFKYYAMKALEKLKGNPNSDELTKLLEKLLKNIKYEMSTK